MPIKHLTLDARMPRIGKLRKGAAMPSSGNRPGADLAHFRFTSDEPHIERAFNEVYPKDPRQLIVYMPYGTPDKCFPHFMEAYTAGGLSRRCDGEHVLLERRDGVIENLTGKSVPCAFANGASCLCKPSGRLYLMLSLLPLFGVVEMPTGSIHDIQNIYGALLSAFEFAQMSGLSLLGIPFRLYRKEVKVSTPSDDGRRVRRSKHLVFIEPASEWTMLQLDLIEQRAKDPSFWRGLPAHVPDTISGDQPDIIVDEETGEVLETAAEAGSEPQNVREEPHAVTMNEAIEKALDAAARSYGFYNGTRELMNSFFDVLCTGKPPVLRSSNSGAQRITRVLRFIETHIDTASERVSFAAWLVRGKWSVDSEGIDSEAVIEHLIEAFKQT